MNNFDYAQPRNLTELIELLSPDTGVAEILAGGTDLVGLMKKMTVTPDRVVDIRDVEEIQGVERNADSAVVLGAATRLDELLENPLTEPFDALRQAIRDTASMQFQAQSTLGGELLRRPRCWYFRSGHGLLAGNGNMVVEGDNRYHAILGNSGPAKFVSASRLAPALIALGAQARVYGPKSNDVRDLPLEDLYHSPRREGQRESVLKTGQVVGQIILQPNHSASASYEVRHGEGPDAPLAAAAAAVSFVGNVVRQARIVLGHVAPVPWLSKEAAREIIGQPISDYTAEAAGRAAVAQATPLKDNHYKVQLAKVAVKRALLQAGSLPTGGFYV